MKHIIRNPFKLLKLISYSYPRQCSGPSIFPLLMKRFCSKCMTFFSSFSI